MPSFRHSHTQIWAGEIPHNHLAHIQPSYGFEVSRHGTPRQAENPIPVTPAMQINLLDKNDLKVREESSVESNINF